MRSQRLIGGRNALAREYSEADLSPIFRSNGTAMPDTTDYARHLSENFANWRLVVDGLVARPLSIPIQTLRVIAAPHADHPPRLRRGMERDRQMARRAALAHPRPCRAQHARQIYRLPLRRPLRSLALLREHRSGRRLPSADHPRLGNERAFAARPQRRAAAPARSSGSSATSTPSTFSGSRRSRALRECTAARAATGRIAPTINGMRGFSRR